MQRKTKIQLVFLLLIGIGFSACLKVQSVSPIPAIEFKSWTLGLDSNNKYFATAVISFTDGDGDIGGGTFPDSTAPYNVQTPPFYDFIMLYYYQDHAHGGIFKRYAPPFSTDSFKLPYHLTNLTPSGPNKSLQGVISTLINIPAWWPTDPNGKPIAGQQNFKYEIFIYDRAGHKSNVVSTPLMQIP